MQGGQTETERGRVLRQMTWEWAEKEEVRVGAFMGLDMSRFI